MDDNRTRDDFRMMCRIRVFEDAVLELTAAGEVPGYVHPYTGQEAVATGVLGRRDPSEWVVSYYRCHGHALAAGSDPLAVLREIMARRGGLCGGKGGSMHLADRAHRLLGASSVVAAQLPIAAGVAMTEQGTGRAVVVFCGDGALGAGVAYETLTVARLRGLSLLVVCEDNGWQDRTPSPEVAVLTPAELAAGLGVPHRVVDGNDVGEVGAAAGELLAECRAGAGPRLLVAGTYLRDFHAQAGPTRPPEYRPAHEIAAWRDRDPLWITACLLSDAAAIEAEVAAEIAEVVASAKATPHADPATATRSLTAAAR
ncbi:MAG TPA: thiamine pyrophosphate-dependent dehydrogenase E1 component subunit alpha [Pseudonocardiaceae bacterium]|nr:thiamine pyrophosphate-dependent dehydrogenase E1 component subunit alpha [Pseudonocardiaceae bacterium]